MKPEASKRYIKHFSICNIKGSEKFSWYLPVHLIPGVPDLSHKCYCAIRRSGTGFDLFLNPKNGDCAIICGKSISCVNYFSWPNFKCSRGLMDRTSFYNTRGLEFKSNLKQRE